MKILLLLALSLAPLLAQPQQNPADTAARYIAQKETVLSSASEKITIQQPVTGAKVVIFETAFVYSSVACDFTLSRDGTAATTLQFTPTPTTHNVAASKAKAYSGSDAGSGTSLGVHSVPAGSTYLIDLSKEYLDVDGTARNLSIATNSISGTVRITFQWVEK